MSKSSTAAQSKNAKPKRRERPLYHAAKISNYRFRKVLWHFVCDDNVVKTAQQTGLSANSVAAIFQKIREYYFESGLFMDFYAGEGATAARPEPYENLLLRVHRRRMAKQRRPIGVPTRGDQHLAESWWRLDFLLMTLHRPAETVRAMMLSHLLTVIRIAGPIGTKPKITEKLYLTLMEFIDQKIRWLHRNAPEFSQPDRRAGLEEALNLKLPP